MLNLGIAQAKAAAVTERCVVAVQVLISAAVMLLREACTEIFPLPTRALLLIVFNVTAPLVPFTDSTYVSIQLQAAGCNSRLPPIARNTNWSIPSAVRVKLVPYGFVIFVPNVIA